MSQSSRVRWSEIVVCAVLAVLGLGLSACSRRQERLNTKEEVEAKRPRQETIPDEWQPTPFPVPRQPAVRVPEAVAPTFRSRVLRGYASLGSAEQSGGPGVVDVGAVGRIVRGHTGGLRACYERALAGHPTLSVRLVLRFVVDGRGRVTEITSSGAEAERSMTGCVIGRVRGLVFPMPEGGDVTVEIPMTFTPGD